LHHDGLIDTADGLGAPEERRLEAMEDSRVGASGVLALVMVVLLQVAALIQLGPHAPIGLCLAAFWARVSPLWAMARFDYLRADGTAAFHRDHARPLWDALPTLLVVALLAGVVAPFPLLLGMVVAILVAQALGRRLGGHTGDSYGAVLVLTEMITLLGLALLLPAS
jgi:adenosylcobinamide-GDP ribazoletransferase